MTSKTSTPEPDDADASGSGHSLSEKALQVGLRQALADVAGKDLAAASVLGEMRKLGLRFLEEVLWPKGRTAKQVDALVAEAWGLIDEEVARHPRLSIRSNPVQLPSPFFKRMLTAVPGRFLWLAEAHIPYALVAETPKSFADAVLATVRNRLNNGRYEPRSHRADWWLLGSTAAGVGGRLSSVTEATLAETRQMLLQFTVAENELQIQRSTRESRELALFREAAVMRLAPLMVDNVIGPTELFGMFLRAVSAEDERMALFLLRVIANRNAAERLDWVEALARTPRAMGATQHKLGQLIRNTPDDWADAQRILALAATDRAAAGREAFCLLQHRSAQGHEHEHIEVVTPREVEFDCSESTP